jgi:hypothetical protein
VPESSPLFNLVTDRWHDYRGFEYRHEEPDRVRAGEVTDDGRVEKDRVRVFVRQLFVDVSRHVGFPL